MVYSFYSQQNICQKKGKFRPSQASVGNLNRFTRLRQDSTFVAEAATSAEQVAPRARPP